MKKIFTLSLLLGASFLMGIATERGYGNLKKAHAPKAKKVKKHTKKVKNRVSPVAFALDRLHKCETELKKCKEDKKGLTEELNYLSSTEYEERLCGFKEEESSNEEENTRNNE